MPSAPGPRVSVRQSPLWMAHHWPEHYDRCTSLGRFHVCRRCLVLYPLTFATILGLVVFDVPVTGARVAAMWMLPLPMVAEWVAEHAGLAAYSARRQALLAAIAAPALGIALTAHLRDPFTPIAGAPVVLYAAICALSAVIGTIRSHEDLEWEQHHDRDEHARREALASLLADSPATPPGSDRTSPPG